MNAIEVIRELESLIRKSEDSAYVNDQIAHLFREPFNKAVNGSSSEDRDRSMELYDWVVNYPKQAAQMRHEAAIFQAAIDLIKGTK